MEKNEVRPRKLPQYIAGLTATLGAFAAGFVVGWSSAAGDNGAELKYTFEINPNDFSWVCSIFILGAAVTSIPVGIAIDLIGRKRSMLMATVPYTIGWACVIWPNSVGTLIFGRFVLGLSIGIFWVALPIYTGEIADVETRGRLGSYLELNAALGLLVAYTLDLVQSMFLYSLISATVPLIFFATFYFMPETPTYHLMRGNVDSARESLIWLRGHHYDVEPELNEKRNALTEAKRNKISFFVAIRSRAALKGLFVAFGLTLFQQLSGMSAIIFYGSAIFADATGEISKWPIIIVGVLQVVAVMLSTLVVDSWGRRIPLFSSGAVMCFTSLVLGVYFYLNVKDDISLKQFRWLPLICICGFVVAFDFGFGPVTCLMIGEIFSPQIKGVAASSAGTFACCMTFVVTKFYVDMKDQIGAHNTFWVFSAFCGLSVVFVFFAVPETKGKTLEQIQIELRG